MKKAALLLSLTALLSIGSNAQTTKKLTFFGERDTLTKSEYGHLALVTGYSITTNDFGSTEASSKSAGRAKNAFITGLEFNAQFGKKKRHGIAVKLVSADYSLNSDAQAKRIENVFNTSVYDISTGSYKITTFSVGHNIQYQLNTKMSLAFRYMFTYNSFTSPEVTAILNTSPTKETLTTNSVNNSSGGFGVGVYLKTTAPNSRVFTMLYFENMVNTQSYSNIVSLTNNGSATLDNTLSISRMNLGALIGIRLYKNK